MKGLAVEKTRILSARLPESFAKELKVYCQKNDLSVSDVIKKGFTNSTQVGLFEAPEPDANTSEFLFSLGAGSAIGLLVYKGVYSVLKERKPDMEEDQLLIYSTVAAIACAMFGGFGLSKIIKAFQE